MAFFLDSMRELRRGSSAYWLWLAGLTLVFIVGVVAYSQQLRLGLSITGMTDQVSWGIYIANFTFLVGIAAAAVMVVIPAYLFHHEEAKHVVMLAEGVAVAACVACMLFVTVDLGQPLRFWHMIPLIGSLNWPQSMLAWDVLVLMGYLLINLFLPMYLLYQKYNGKHPEVKKYMWVVYVSIVWAIGIHTVTAFLYSWNPARPFWHTAILGPRFLASAFTAGPATIILALYAINRWTDFRVKDDIVKLLTRIVMIALMINLFMIGAEVFTEFYTPTTHSASAEYLFFGLGEQRRLVPWMRTALALEFVALAILAIPALQRRFATANLACVLAIVGIWIEKGMGLIIPGFIPTPLGDVVEYMPTLLESLVSLGILALAMIVFTVLAKPAIAIETGRLRRSVN